MQKTQLSIQQQIVLCLSVVLLFSICLTIAGYMAGEQEREKIAGFSSDGAVATGTITKKYIRVVGPGRTWVYWLDLTFTTPDGVLHTASTNVANTIHDRYKVGSPVQVTYIKSRPEYFHIPDTGPTQRDVGMSDGMFRYGAMASAACLVALLGVLYRGGASGTPARQSPPPQQPRNGTPHRGRQPRTSFGTRRA